MANDPNTIQYVIQEDGFWYIASKEKNPYVPYITVSAKGVANGLSTEYNDGYDFGPDSYDPNSTASIPYTQTAGIQEAVNYGSDIFINGENFPIQTQINIPDKAIRIRGKTPSAPTVIGPTLTASVSSGSTVIYPANNTTSNFPKGLFYYSMSESVGFAFETILFNCNGININGIYIQGPTNGAQAYGKLDNVSAINIAPAYSGIYLSIVYNSTISNGFATGYGYSITYSNANSVFWIKNFQDFTVSGESFSGFAVVTKGIQQQITVGSTGSSLLVDGGSFSNAFAPYCLFINGAAVTDVTFKNTSFIVPAPNTNSVSDAGFMGFGGSGSNIASLSFYNCGFSVSSSSTTPKYNMFSSSGIGTLIAKDCNVGVSGGTSGVIPSLTGNGTIFPFSLLANPENNAFNAQYLMVYDPVITLSANPPASATVYQNTNPYDIEIDLPAYASTSGTAGYVTIAKGATDTPTAISNQYVSGDTSSTTTQIIRLRVPAGWYYEFTASGVTFATASVFAD